MKLSFKLDDWPELYDSLSKKYPDMNECYYVRVKDTYAFTVQQWRIVIPEYGFSVREGMQLQEGQWEDVTVFYPLDEKRPSKYDYMYCNTFFESAIAYQAGDVENDNPDCIIDTGEFEVKRYKHKKTAVADTATQPAVNSEKKKKNINENQLSLFDDF